jgi:hypothetical protein
MEQQEKFGGNVKKPLTMNGKALSTPGQWGGAVRFAEG